MIRSLDTIRPAPENDRLYRPVLASDPAIVDLAESIGAEGVLVPIMVSLDGFILSGHRRYVAAGLAGLTEVPVSVADVSRAREPDRFLTLLREHNRQRVKSLDEQVREAVLDANPDECFAELEAHRLEKSKVSHDRLSIGEARTRKRISSAKQPFVDAIVRTLNGLRAFWPVSDRQIHYGLLNAPPLKHASKPESIYVNDRSSYKALVELLTRLRLFGEIPFDCIGDETRPVSTWNTHREPGAFVAEEIEGFLKGYCRDYQQSQPNHVEIVVEKNTIAPIVRPVAMQFHLPMTSGRGYCSLPPRHDMAQRFQRSGKSKLVVLLVTDFDPDGESIAESFARSMRDDFGIGDGAIHPVKVALTREQIDAHGLITSMEAKAGSSRTAAFVAQHGASVWELEAMPPIALQEIVRDAVRSVLDLDAFTSEQQQEARDAMELRAIRETVSKALGDLRLLRAVP